jgi:peptidoglycan-N-acetylglucosamine deacetylase
VSASSIAVAATFGLIGLWALVTVAAHYLTALTGWGTICRGRHTGAVALTFDDGPHPTHTRQICQTLEAHGARGTFFVLAEQVEAHPELLCELIERGHEVQLHGLGHLHLWFTPPWVTARELREALRVIEEVGGIRPTCFRPPWGMRSLFGFVVAHSLKLRTVCWSVCPEGFFVRRPGVELAERTLSRLRAGDIVCLHDAGGFDDTPVRVEECLRTLLPALAERGLLALGLSDVLAG